MTGLAFLHVDEVSDILFVWTGGISEHLIFELPIDKKILTVVLNCTIRSVAVMALDSRTLHALEFTHVHVHVLHMYIYTHIHPHLIMSLDCEDCVQEQTHAYTC